MKKLILILTLFVLTLSLQAKVWVVNNNAGGPGDFTTASAAHNAALDGDTLYFVGSNNYYGASVFIVTKKLVLIGPGYFLNENPNTYSNKSTAYFNGITLDQSVTDNLSSGASGSVLLGLEIATVSVKVNDISVVRCKVTTIDNMLGSATDLTGLLVKQSYWTAGATGSGKFFSSVMKNTIYKGTTLGFYNSEIRNNTFSTNYGGDAGNIFINNVFTDYTTITFNYNMDPNNLRNNIFGGNNTAGTSYTTGLNNVFGAFGNIISTSGSADGIFKLKDGSVAIGAGEGGVDCGAFGGSEPYILSGLPPIPVIYEINIPTTVNKADGLEIQIKAKVQN